MSATKRPAQDRRPRLYAQERDGSSSSTPSRRQLPIATYDTDTGQMYKETSVHVGKRSKINWIHEYKTPGLVKRRHQNREGAASLFDMARGKVAREMINLTSAHFAGLPASIGRRVWDEVEDSRLESFHAWRTMVRAFPDSFKSPFRRYFLDIKDPVLPPSSYFGGLDSPSLNWLSCLRIPPASIDRADMVRIAEIRNLAVLDLSADISVATTATTQQIDERLFRTWAELSESGNAFQHLHVMLMRGQPDVSTWIFPYLHRFPSLCCIIFTDCRLIHQKNRAVWTDAAAQHGWDGRHGKKSARSVKTLIDDQNFYVGAVSGFYYHTADAVEALAMKQQSATTTTRLPIVEAWLGKPKPWFHLIEEFPGTRTVWFDKVKTRAETAAAAAVPQAEGRRKRTTQAAPAALPERPNTPLSPAATATATAAEECAKRTRDMLSPAGSDAATRSPPPKRNMITTTRSKWRNLDQLMAEFGREV